MAPRNAVRAQPAAPPRVGLLASAVVLTGSDERWETGFAIEPEACGNGGVGDPCAPGAKTLPDGPAIIEGEPFYVWEGDKCSTLGRGAREDRRARAERQLRATESYQIAREFWRGEQIRASDWDSQFLASAVADELNEGGAALDPIDALACLEEGLGKASKGQRGMIHATRQVVTKWDEAGMLYREGPALRVTVNDTIVVADAGYDGSGPVPGAAVATPANLAGVGAAGGTLAEDSYGYKVTAITAYGESAATAEAVGVVGVGEGSIDLTWDDVAGATGYRVYGRTQTGPWLLLAETVTSDYTDDGSDVPAGAAAPATAVNGPEPADATQWAYATSLVVVRLGPIETPGANDAAAYTDQSVNTQAVIAERLAAASFDGCAHLAVEIDYPYCGAVGGAA